MRHLNKTWSWWVTASLLTCVFVCELDEAVGDVSPSVEANHLRLHIPTGRLKQWERRDPGWLQAPSNTNLLFPKWPGSFVSSSSYAAMTVWPGPQRSIWTDDWLIDWLSRRIIRPTGLKTRPVLSSVNDGERMDVAFEETASDSCCFHAAACRWEQMCLVAGYGQILQYKH